MALAAVKRLHARMRIVQFPQPEGGEVQARRPTLGSLDEELDVGLVERDLLSMHEQLARLVDAERQVTGADLAQRASRPEAPEWQRRVGPGRHDHPRLLREVLDEVLQRLPARLVGEHVYIVEDDRDRLAVRVHPVQELVDDGLRPRAGRSQPSECATSEPRPDAVDRAGDVGPEAHRVVVGGLQRHPRHGSAPAREPGLDEQGLAEPDGGVHQRQRRGGEPVELIEKPGTRHEADPDTRRAELGLDHERECGAERLCRGCPRSTHEGVLNTSSARPLTRVRVR